MFVTGGVSELHIFLERPKKIENTEDILMLHNQNEELFSFQKIPLKDFPGGPVAKTPHLPCRNPASIPGQGTRPHVT